MNPVIPKHNRYIAVLHLLVSIFFALPLFFVSCYKPVPYLMTEQQLRDFYEDRLSPKEAEQIEVPFLINSEIGKFTDDILKQASAFASEKEKIGLIVDAILSKIQGGVQYSGYSTRNAVDTFRSGNGNCISFTNLFVGMARHARINALFVLVDEIDDFEWSGGILVHQKHMCTGVMKGSKLVLIDFVRGPTRYWHYRAISDSDAVAHYYNNLGYAEFKDGLMEEAIRKYRIAMALAPEFVPAYNNLAVALLRQGKVDEAIAMLKRALTIDSSNLSLYSNLSSALERKGLAEEAKSVTEYMDKMKTSSPYSLFVRGRFMRMRGNPAGAVKLLKKAMSQEPKNLALRLELAHALKETGDLKAAAKQYKKALKIDSESREALNALHELEKTN